MIPWYLRAINAVRRYFGLSEKRYLTDDEWRAYMRSIIPKNPPRSSRLLGPLSTGSVSINESRARIIPRCAPGKHVMSNEDDGVFYCTVCGIADYQIEHSGLEESRCTKCGHYHYDGTVECTPRG